ncbi:SAM-dependent methyltransferase [Saccharopolyspora sp. HNM0983]|uniref:SAM-dependent methyltransferase n=1 Tax=Saccharopolyspora montiporae TaxID=2781240 RepID=A0A929BCW1_9PSEU|nr:SAM-dependent methyltransferase [Saccharopolyspora sp. HNM0983]MBE9376045.1 SAM-dependent methyltransferase [Saccharopolyspora sp. HNM0983]
MFTGREENAVESAFGTEIRDVDARTPNLARMYDYQLGGTHNFAPDRERLDAAVGHAPQTVPPAAVDRAFLQRAVAWCADRGIDQFLDLGSGIPTAGNVHEVARRRAPGSRVVYVDHEPVAVAHGNELLRGTESAAVVHADLLDPDDVLGAPRTAELLDFARPVALLVVGVLHHIGHGADVEGVLAEYRSALAPGSALVLSQLTGDAGAAEVPGGLHPRSLAEVGALFAGFDLMAPGLVPAAVWHPADPHEHGCSPRAAVSWAGVGVRGQV